MNGAEVAALRQLILECAAGHQLSVHAIYVDELDTAPDQLVECLAAVLNADESVVIVPSLLHFAGFGNPSEVRRDFESNGIRVLIAHT